MTLTLTHIPIVVLAALALAVLAVTAVVPHQQAFALKNFFNCMTEIANKNHKLTIDDVNSCYAKEFHNPPH